MTKSLLCIYMGIHTYTCM